MLEEPIFQPTLIRYRSIVLIPKIRTSSKAENAHFRTKQLSLDFARQLLVHLEPALPPCRQASLQS